MSEKIKYKLSNDLRRQAEEIAMAKIDLMPENIDLLSHEEYSGLLHELRVHQIELEIQNEELRRTQEELESSKARYFELYHLAPVGYFTINEKGMILEANLTAATLLNVDRRMLVNQPLSRIIFKEDQDIYYMHRKKLFETDEPQVCELRMLRDAGDLFWARLEATVGQDTDGLPVCRVVMSDINEHKLADDKIKALLAEKQLLLKEVHHRVKNNMNTINSLIYLQINSLKDPAAIAALNDTSSRVKSMIVLYDKLTSSANFDQISVKEYLSSLMNEIVSSFPNSKSVKIEEYIDDFTLEAKTLSVIGIIINELLTNIMKYAFTDRSDGLITISAFQKDNTNTFVIQDNGNGIPESVDIENSTGFGLMLVAMLTRQLEGKIRMECEKGTKIVLEFKI